VRIRAPDTGDLNDASRTQFSSAHRSSVEDHAVEREQYASQRARRDATARKYASSLAVNGIRWFRTLAVDAAVEPSPRALALAPSQRRWRQS